MIHARGRARGLEKLIISRKLKSSLVEGRVCFCSASSLSPLSSPCSRNGRNFKRKFTNEGDFPRTPLRRFPRRKRRSKGKKTRKRRRLRRGKSHGAFPFSAFHHQHTARDFLEVASSFFFHLNSYTRASCRPRKMRYRDPDKNLPFHVPRS